MWMKVVERGYKLTNMDECGWKWIKVDKNGLRVKNSKKIAVHTTYARPERRRREGWQKKGKRLTILSISKYSLVLFLCCVLFLCSFLFLSFYSNLSKLFTVLYLHLWWSCFHCTVFCTLKSIYIRTYPPEIKIKRCPTQPWRPRQGSVGQNKPKH